jgi:hypothetical protein
MPFENESGFATIERLNNIINKPKAAIKYILFPFLP